MLDLLGSGYVIECCISTFKRNQEQKAFQYYVSDCLRCISESCAMSARGGPYIKNRFMDLINPKKQDERTGEEIALDIIKRMKLKFKGDS